MGLWREGNTTFFLCDVCRAERTDTMEGSWDELKLVIVRAKEDGWRIKKDHRSQWEALCPDCADSDGYSLRIP
jgi:hypothetical protein